MRLKFSLSLKRFLFLYKALRHGLLAFHGAYVLLRLILLVEYGDFVFLECGGIVVKCGLHLGCVAAVRGGAHHLGLLHDLLRLQLLLDFDQRLGLHLQ